LESSYIYIYIYTHTLCAVGCICRSHHNAQRTSLGIMIYQKRVVLCALFCVCHITRTLHNSTVYHYVDILHAPSSKDRPRAVLLLLLGAV
jgi:hypothetical protein